MPRIVIFGSNAAGHFHSAADHGVVAARGTRKWHREHCVMELPPGMKNARISIDTYGIQGTLRVNHLQVELVRPRVWSELTGIILLAGWVLWLAWNLHPLLRGNYRALRSLLLGSALLASFATFVFPQPRSLERSIGLQFWLGSGPIAPSTPPCADVAPSIVENTAAHPPSQPKGSRLRTLPPPTDEELHAPPPSQAMPRVPIPQAKPIVIDPPSRWEALRASAREQLMAMDRKWNFRSYNLTHFTSFFAISCCVLLLARRVRLLWIVGAMAVSAEIIPDLVHDVGDSGDFYDLLANALGIIAALLLHRMFSYFLSKRRKKHARADQVLSDKA
jgi:hypothetical protein